MIIYGIPNCDTVKKAQRFFEDKGKPYHFHDFRKDGLDGKKVALWLSKVGADVLVNKKSTTWRGLSEAQKQQVAGEGAVQILCDNPTLIKRPVIERGHEVFVGFNAKIAEVFS